MKIDGREYSAIELVAVVVGLVMPVLLQFFLVVVTRPEEDRFRLRYYLPLVVEREELEKYVPWTRAAILALPRPSQEELEVMFGAYGSVYGVSPGLLRVVARCESGFNPGALSVTGKYGGLYQFDVRTWIGVRRRMGLEENPNLRFDAEEAVKTAAFKVGERDLSAWPVCGGGYYGRS